MRKTFAFASNACTAGFAACGIVDTTDASGTALARLAFAMVVLFVLALVFHWISKTSPAMSDEAEPVRAFHLPTRTSPSTQLHRAAGRRDNERPAGLEGAFARFQREAAEGRIGGRRQAMAPMVEGRIVSAGQSGTTVP